MKLIFWTSVALLAASLIAATAETASAQSDKTLGINCTVAGHIRCGENGYVGHRSYHWRRHYPHRHVIYDY